MIRVLELIKLDDGGTRYVEQLRGKLTNDPTKNRKVDEDIAVAAKVRKNRDKKTVNLSHLEVEYNSLLI